ncbi:uncharacterized protein [Leptinotarsa decemlineata]|uniref:uncharacterized protein n=1 Tax=Leptinotarsa decemlineata TaxID=7539 RepID=UPI003D30B2FB
MYPMRQFIVTHEFVTDISLLKISRRGLKRHAVPVLFLPETIEEPRGMARMSRSSVAGQEQYEDMCQPSTSIPEQEICFGTPSINEIISVTQGHSITTQNGKQTIKSVMQSQANCVNKRKEPRNYFNRTAVS